MKQYENNNDYYPESEFDYSFLEEFTPTKEMIKINIREQLKTLKLITNINEIQRMIDSFELNKNNNKNFSKNLNYMLNSSSCDYNHSYSYLKHLFKAKLIELYILIIKNYMEVNKFNFNIDKVKELRNIINRLLGIYNCFSQRRTIMKIREIIDESGIEGREI